MPTDTYSISDLARLTGVNVRTIRYYLAQGLLPASGESGPGAHYGDGHLDRLRLTRRLQQQHLPLAEIRRRLAELTDADIASVLATIQAPASSPTTSALDYVRAVLANQVAPTPSAPASAPVASMQMAPPAPAAAPEQTARPVLGAAPARSRFLRRPGYARMGMVSEETVMPTGAAPTMPAMRDVEPASRPVAGEVAAPLSMPPLSMPPMRDEGRGVPAPTTEPPGLERSQWERLALTPDIELHIRRPLGRLEQRRVERLITIARQVLKEGKP